MAAISHTFFSRRPFQVVTNAHHGVALPSFSAARAVALDGAGLEILVRNMTAATAFPTAVAYSWGLAEVEWFYGYP